MTSSDHKQPIVVAYEKPADMSCEVYDARGNGEGGVAPTLTGDHQNRITDYTAILAIEARHEEPRCYEDGVSPAIIARAGTGGGVIPRWFSWKPACVMGSTCWNAPFTDGKVVPTICARAGTGGNQLPLVVLKRNEE